MNLKYCFYELTTLNIQLVGPEFNLATDTLIFYNNNFFTTTIDQSHK